jgi:hypothetical protein
MLAGGTQQKKDFLVVFYIRSLAKGRLLAGYQINRLLEGDIPAGKMNRAVQLKMVDGIHRSKVAIGLNVTSFFNSAVSSIRQTAATAFGVIL